MLVLLMILQEMKLLLICGSGEWFYVVGTSAKKIQMYSVTGPTNGKTVYYFKTSDLDATGEGGADVEYSEDNSVYLNCPVPSEERSFCENGEKRSKPVKVKVGGSVTYQIVVCNTGNYIDGSCDEGAKSWLLDVAKKGRKATPLFKPADIFVDVTDKLPIDCIDVSGSITVTCDARSNGEESASASFSRTASVDSSGNFTLNKVYVPAGGCTIIQFTVHSTLPEGSSKLAENTARVGNVYNRNDKDVTKRNIASSARLHSSDYFGMKDRKPDDASSAGDVYVKKVEHLTYQEDPSGKEELEKEEDPEEDGEDPEAPDPRTTYEGKGTNIYAEYGDIITWGIDAKITWVPEEDIGEWEKKEYEDPEEEDTAQIELRLELPDADKVWIDGGCYVVWIENKQYHIPTEFGKKFKYIIDADSVSIKEDIKEQGEEKYEKSHLDGSCPGSSDDGYAGCTIKEVEDDDCVHKWKEVTKLSQFYAEKSDIEVKLVANTRKKDDKIELGAAVTEVVFEHSYGKLYNEAKEDPHTHTITDEDGNSTTTTVATAKHCDCKADTEDRKKFIYEHTMEANGTKAKKDGKHYYYDEKNAYHDNGECYTGGQTIGSAYCVITDYTATIQQYIYRYNAEMLDYNNANDFTNETKDFIENGTYDEGNPLKVEKYESLEYRSVVTNKALGRPAYVEEEDESGSGNKYKTRVRAQTVVQTLAPGLRLDRSRYTNNTSTKRQRRS